MGTEKACTSFGYKYTQLVPLSVRLSSVLAPEDLVSVSKHPMLGTCDELLLTGEDSTPACVTRHRPGLIVRTTKSRLHAVFCFSRALAALRLLSFLGREEEGSVLFGCKTVPWNASSMPFFASLSIVWHVCALFVPCCFTLASSAVPPPSHTQAAVSPQGKALTASISFSLFVQFHLTVANVFVLCAWFCCPLFFYLRFSATTALAQW